MNLPLVLQGPGDVTTPIGAVIVGERTDTLEVTVGILEQTLWLASLAGLALAAAGGWWIARRALRPVDVVTAAAAAIAADPAMRTSLDRRLSVPEAKDELQRLALTFNAMLDQISSTFSAQRQFLADASHDLRTPLTAIRGNSEVLGRQLAGLPESTPGIVPVREAAADIQRESERMGRLLEDLLLLARTDSMGSVPGAIRATGPVRLDELVIDVSRTAQALAGGQRLHVETQAVATIGDRDRLTQMILVLVDNALRHTAPGRSITVSARCDGNESLVTVADQGAGIAPADLPRIFDRFYRVDASRERQTGGAGLGLAIAKAIAEAHGGSITVESVVGAGSTFSVRLPGCTVVEATQLPAPSA
ncbi:MAG: sensor histidine kinase [Chloroflexota bacterium]